jgi:phage protein D
MNVVTLDQESRDQGGFYVPRYEIHIEGAGLPGDVLRDVTQLTYKDDIKGIDSFELTVNNWDPTNNSFKYVGSETTDSLQRDTRESKLYHLFEPSHKEVQVKMGYMSDLRVMMTGNFTTMEPNFPSGGAPTLIVRGLNVLHRLRTKQYTTTWANKTDSEIAEQIDKMHDHDTGRERFPLPIQTDPAAKSKEHPLVYLTQNSQYDIDFLFGRARERGYVVFVQEFDPKVRGSKRRLYFGSSDGRIPGLRDVTFKLEWGKSLIDFKPTLTTANQVRSVTVHGWNRSTRKPISEKVTLDDPRLTRNRDLHDLLKKSEPREEEVVDEPVFTDKQARERALALLSDRQKEMVKASGTTIGLPDLRAGQRVQIHGLGARFNGTYFITGTTHTIGESGYTTRFEARREDGGKGGD